MLELRDGFAESPAGLETLGTVIEQGLSHARPTRSNANPPVSQCLQCDLETLPRLANNVRHWHLDVVEVDVCSQLAVVAQFLVWFTNTNTWPIQFDH
ncbi:hypothetical protein D3C84_1127990 [compost metagenome]